MVCENQSSSSTSVPSSEYILTGIKEFLIHNIDPSKISSDINTGRQQKERMISAITHELLNKKVPNYFAKESKVSQLLGSKFTEFLIGNVAVAENSTPTVPPVVNYLDEIDVTSSEFQIAPTLVEENDYPLSEFITTWTIISQPVANSLIFNSVSVLDPILTFLAIGDFVVRVMIKSDKYKMGITQLIVLHVQLDTSSSSSI